MKKQQILIEFIKYSGKNNLRVTSDGRIISEELYKQEINERI